MVSVIIDTLLTSVQAVITVLVVYLCGFMVVHLKLLDSEGVKTLSTLSNFLFFPTLFFVRLAKGLDLETLKNAWTLPVLGLLISAVQFLLAHFLTSWIAKPTPKFKRFFVLGQSTSNFVALPLVLVSSVCSRITFNKPDYTLEFPREFYIANNQTEELIFSREECQERGDLYMFMYSLIVSIVLWTFGYEYVNVNYEEDHGDESTSSNVEEADEKAIMDDKTESVLEVSAKPASKTSPGFSSMKDFTVRFITGLARPASASQFLGVFCGLIQPVQYTLFDPKGALQSVMSGVEIVSTAGTSVINLIVSASLSLKVLKLKKWTDVFGNEEELGASKRTLLCFAVFRMAIVPGIFFIVFRIIEMHFFELVPKEDELQHLALYLELLTPTANQVVLMAQVVKQPYNGEVLAMGVLLQYLLGIITITGYMFLALYMLDLL